MIICLSNIIVYWHGYYVFSIIICVLIWLFVCLVWIFVFHLIIFV